MIIKYLFLSSMVITCCAMEQPFTRTHAEIDIEILCKLVPTDTSHEESIISIRALKNVMLTCKKLHRASQDKKVTDYFMGHIAYDPTCPVYTVRTINERLDPVNLPAEKQLRGARTITLDSLRYHCVAVEKRYLNFQHPTRADTDLFNDEESRQYIADQKQTNQAYKNSLFPSYQVIYAALNINTPQTRALFMQDVKKYPFKGYHALMLACLYGNSLVPELLNAYVNANSVHTDVRAHAPINVAVLFGLTTVVKHFILHSFHKAYVETCRQDFEGETPFTRALRMGHSQIIRLFAQNLGLSFWSYSNIVPADLRTRRWEADEYIERFCPAVDTETRAFIKQKTLEQRRIDR